jgi:PAS domain S-box-containing protein
MNILHLEDNRDDARLVEAILQEEWPACRVIVVANREDYLHQLRAGGHDLILSDFSLAAYNGLEALARARAEVPEVPFIFLSGTIGEHRALEAVKAGAQDYVLKDNLRRLVAAVRRVLREQEERARRAAAEDALRRFAAVLESTPDFVGLAARDGRVFWVNKAGLRLIGRAETYDPGLLTLADLHPADIRERLAREGLPAAAASGSWVGESALQTAAGVRVPVSQALIAHQAADGSVEYYSTVMRDLSAFKQAERHIREQADLLNKARDAIVVSDLDDRIVFWNQGAERIFGWRAAEVTGRKVREVLDAAASPDAAELAAAADEDGEWRSEVNLRTKRGEPLVAELRVTLIRDEQGRTKSRLSIATDVTKRRKIEEQFLRAQRLESIGMLAAGIAHDLNNVLAPILMAAPMLRERALDPADRKLIASLEASAQRGAGLVRQILGFAQGIGGEPQLMAVESILADIASVVRQTFPRSIQLSTSTASDLWAVKANPTQLHQVLLNLCVNARDAMPSGGRLSLVAENLVIDDLVAATMDGARAGAYVVLQVSDTGSGISPEVQQRIWEPFFTTKEATKGSGLGLSTVLGIVNEHQGFVTLKTEPGRGTTFRVHLPAALTNPEKPGAPVPLSAPRGNGELVLVVDDEPDVREVTSAILAHHGYRVLTAGDGAEAVTLLAPRSTEVKIVVTDLQMPHLDGASLASVVRRLNPAIRIIVMSGMDGARATEVVQRIAATFLAKPFKSDELLGAVAVALGASASSGVA